MAKSPSTRQIFLRTFSWVVVTASLLSMVEAEEVVSVIGLVHDAREAVGTTNNAAALALTSHALELDPAYGEAWKQQGRVLMLMHRPEEALQSFFPAQILLPKDEDLTRWQQHTLVDLGRYRELATNIEQWTDPEVAALDRGLVARLLSTLLDDNDGPAAARLAARWSRAVTNETDYASAMALFHLASQDPDTAARHLAHLRPTGTNINPMAALAFDRWGVALMAQREPEKAIAAFNASLTHRPDGLNALRDLGWALRQAGQPEKAISTWQRGISLSPSAMEWSAWVADTQLQLGQADKAEQSTNDLLAAVPEHEQGRILKLAALLIQNSPEAARFETEVRSGLNGRRLALLGRVRADRHTGDYAVAAERLEDYLRDAPSDVVVRSTLLEVYRDWAASVPRKDSMKPLERMLALEPRHAGAQRDLGWAWWSQGDHEKGLALLDESIRNNVGNRDEVIVQVYTALMEDGQRDRATEKLKEWAPGTSMADLGRRLFAQGRLVAAEPALELAWLAWANTQDPRDIGLLLAFTHALKGECENWTTYFDPRTQSSLDLLEADQLDMLFEILTLCADNPEAFALMAQAEKLTKDRPEFDPRVTGAVEAAADRSRQQGDYGLALRLYRRVLARDRDRLCYLRAAECAEALGRRDSAVTLLQEIARATSSEAVRQGALGKVAAYRGDLKRAITSYQKSLEVAPDQEDVRRALFAALILQNRLPEAREQAAWFVQKLESGARHLRPELAEMWTALGDRQAALKFWQELAQTYPASAYFTIEYARALYLAGQPVEAERLLKALVEKRPEVRAYTLLAELHSALGRHEQVLEDTGKGLDLEITRDLLRLLAEAAEALGRPSIAYASATALLNDDPGNAAMARLASRSLLDQGLWPEARLFAAGLTNRNSANLDALLALSEVARRTGRTKDAVQIAETVTRQRPWDLEALRRESIAWMERGHFAQALRVLQGHVEEHPAPPVAALLYHDVISGPYPGRNTPEQIAAHVAGLAGHGYRFLTPDQLDLNKASTEKAVLLFIADTDAQTLEALDRALAEHGARATYAGFSSDDARRMPGQPTQQQLKALRENGRWFIASSGPMELVRDLGDGGSPGGNALVERRRNVQTGQLETDAELQQRQREMLEDLADALPASPRVLLYPRGDYGQRALDSDAVALESLRRAVGGPFQLAFAADDSGVLPARPDPLRMPLKTVPPNWSADHLLAHIRISNPAVNLQLQQANVYYLNHQYPEAEAWFAAAMQNGAPPLKAPAGTVSAGADNNRIALDRLSLAFSNLDPSGAQAQRILNQAPLATEANPLLYVRGENDNRNRSYLRTGTRAGWPVNQSLRPEFLLDHTRWKSKGLPSVDGLRYGAGTRWSIQPQTWVDGQLWRMDYEGHQFNDYWGGFLRVRVPQPFTQGEINLEATREEVGTVEAIQRAIEQWNYAIRTTARIADQADLTINGSYLDRDDINDTRQVDGRLLWQVRNQPYAGYGIYAQIADSWKNAAEYYAPMEVHQYQLMGEWRGTQGPLTYQATAQAGYARAQYRDWRFAWSTRVLMEYAIWRRLYGFVDANYLDTVGYQRWLMSGGVGARF